MQSLSCRDAKSLAVTKKLKLDYSDQHKKNIISQWFCAIEEQRRGLKCMYIEINIEFKAELL